MYNREFDAYIILGDPALPPLWTHQAWPSVTAILNPLITQARGPAAVRSFQLSFGAGSPNDRWVRFGRLGWSERASARWTHASVNGLDREFCDAEVWAPSWTVCYRENRAPEVFFKIENEDPEGGQTLVFNPVITLAVALDQGPEIVAMGRKTAEDLALRVNAVLRGYRRRLWGYTGDYPEWESNIEDARHFKVGPPQRRAVDMSTFEQKWEPF